MVFEGTHKPVLDPYQGEHAFSLDDAPVKDVLNFSIGFRDIGESGSVRFDVLHQGETGEPVTIYRRELDTPGWVDERLDLSRRGVTGGRLILRKSLVQGSLAIFFRSAWGDPTLWPEQVPKRPSVILVSIDALRADRVGAYGYAKAETPSLDALAKAGTLYEDAYSPSTWTFPSHAALLFGLPPASLPAKDKRRTAATRPLPELFRAAGYLTAAFTGGGFLADEWSLSRGFGTYFTYQQKTPQAGTCPPDRFDGAEVFGRGLTWLREHAHLPFFLFLHTYDVHDRCPVRPRELGEFQRWPDPGQPGREELSRYYDRLVGGVDRKIAELLGEVERLGIADSTLIIVTSDHGEAFWEHGFYGHGCPWKPYTELTRVPLIVRFTPSVPAGLRIREPVSLLDVAPTALDLTGLAVPASMQGSALPRVKRSPSPPIPIYVQCKDTLAVRSGRYRLLTSRTGRFPDEVYDVERDPGETKNLAGDDTALDTRLRRLADEFWGRAPADGGDMEPSRELDETTRERLRALGYIE